MIRDSEIVTSPTRYYGQFTVSMSQSTIAEVLELVERLDLGSA